MKKLNLVAPALFLLLAVQAMPAKEKAKPKPDEISALDQYVVEAMSRPGPSP